MKITVNDREIEFEKSTLDDLLTLYRFKSDKIKVSINGSVCLAGGHGSVLLKDGDVIEIGRM